MRILMLLPLALLLFPSPLLARDEPPVKTGLPEAVRANVTENPASGALVPPPPPPLQTPPASVSEPAAPALSAFGVSSDRPVDPADDLGVNAFAFDLYRELSKEEKGNLFLSPFSISTALAMTAAGARGESLAGMEKALRVRLRGDAMHAGFGGLISALHAKGRAGNFELSTANRLFGQKGKPFLPDFLKRVEAAYGTGAIHPLDFRNDADGSRAFINAWVAEATMGKIKDLIPDGVISALTRLVLVNAIYFKGEWEAGFEKSATKEEDFTLADGAKAKAPLMHRKDDYAYAELDGAKAVQLPYKNQELSMIAILPPEGKSLSGWAADLTWERLAPLLGALGKREVDLFLPRFKLETSFLLKKSLIALGMGHACSDAADFSGLDGSKDLKITEVVHKAFVDVNEEGTEAAAATAAVVETKAFRPPEPPVIFRADRPFLFLIRDTASGAILFLGRVERP